MPKKVPEKKAYVSRSSRQHSHIYVMSLAESSSHAQRGGFSDITAMPGSYKERSEVRWMMRFHPCKRRFSRSQSLLSRSEKFDKRRNKLKTERIGRHVSASADS
jgi:hypothetical protein